MTRIGRVDTLNEVYGMVFNPLTGALYAGYPDSTDDAQMWTTSASGELPIDQGAIEFGQGRGIYVNKVRKMYRCISLALALSVIEAPNCTTTIHTQLLFSGTRPSTSTRTATSSMPLPPIHRPTSTSLTWAPERRSPLTLTQSNYPRQSVGLQAPRSESSEAVALTDSVWSLRLHN
jgi:hypothetical protein